MIVKVCGMREPENIRDVEALGVDLMGFIFHPHSPRFVGTVPDYLPADAARVGVFVDADMDTIMTRVSEFGLSYVQLHGHESTDMCRALRESGLSVIKAFSISCEDDFSNCHSYEGVADLFLFDTKCSGFGGSGERFDWALLYSYKGSIPFLLSGGIGPESKKAINAISHPMFAGIDLNSRFETTPAAKDIKKLKTFLQNEQNQ